MSNKAKRARKNKRVLVFAAAVFLVLIAALAYIGSTNQPSSTQKPEIQAASTYFVISDAAGVYTTTSDNATPEDPGPGIRITQFAFTFTPVGGDAKDVRILVAGLADPTGAGNFEGENILNGTSTFSGEINPEFGIPSTRQSDGTYPLKIAMLANDAHGNELVEGDITLNFTASNNIIIQA
jgi:hypothetical protein